MIKKLIILILFLVITVVAIGVVTIPNFGFATQIKKGEKAVEITDATSATVIDAPRFLSNLMGSKVQVVIVHDEAAGYIELLGGDQCYSAADALAAGATYVQGYILLFWIFMLAMIILLPRKRGKKKIKKFAREVAYEVCDEEMENMAPARSYAPAPRRREPAPRAEGRRRQRDDYDDEDYDY